MNENQKEVDRLLNITANYIQSVQNAGRVAAESRQHDDSVMVWIVGLDSGLVIGIFPVLNAVLDVHKIPKLELIFAFVPFILVIVLGVGFRIILNIVSTLDSHFVIAKVGKLELIQFRGNKEIESLRESILEIINDKEEKLKELSTRIKTWISVIK